MINLKSNIDRDFSLRLLGSEVLRDQFIKDIEDLILMAKEKSLKPVVLVVGKLFVDSGIAHLVMESLNIQNWELELERNYDIIADAFVYQRFSTYSKCEKTSGDLSIGSEKRFKVFFDPDEKYLTLKAASKEKAKKEEIQTADGHIYYFLRFDDGEILSDFLDGLDN